MSYRTNPDRILDNIDRARNRDAESARFTLDRQAMGRELETEIPDVDATNPERVKRIFRTLERAYTKTAQRTELGRLAARFQSVGDVHHHHAEFQPHDHDHHHHDHEHGHDHHHDHSHDHDHGHSHGHGHGHGHHHAPYRHIGHPHGPRTMINENVCCCFMSQFPQEIIDEEQARKPVLEGTPSCKRGR